MPSAIIRRSTQLRVITRREAEAIDCEALYATSSRQLGTQDVTIYLQPGDQHYGGPFVPGRPAIQIPRFSRSLSDLLPMLYSHAGITVEYVYGKSGFDPSELLTRQTFVMQTLDIWERMLSTFGKFPTPVQQKSMADLVAAMETLQSTYSIQELLPVDVSMEEFKAYFEPDRSNGDGTSSN